MSGQQKRQEGGSQRYQAAFLLDRQRSMVRMAAKEGMSNLVHLAMQVDPSVDARQLASARGRDDVPLVTACLNGHLDVVKNLIEECQISLDCRADITVEGQDIKGATPLWAASCNGSLDLVRYLVQKGADVNTCTDTKSSPLRVAAFDGHTAVVKFLLEKGADVNSVNSSGHSVLMVACFKNRTDVAKILLDQDDVNVNYIAPDSANKFAGMTALHICAEKGNTDVLKMLLAHGATISHGQDGTTPLLIAAYEGHDDFVNYYLGTPDVSRDDKADALELLGTTHWALKQNTDKCLSLWQRAMEERHKPGRPVVHKREAEKLAVYGYAKECQTIAELRQLQSSSDMYAVGVQCMLIRERILGKEHRDTNLVIRVNAAVSADEDEFERAVELLSHSLDNMALVPAFRLQTLEVYANLVTYLALITEDSYEVKFSYTLKSLKRLMSELQRGQAQLQKDDSILTRSHDFLKIALHLIFLLFQTKDKTSPQNHDDFMQTVVSLVQSGNNGPNGDTLLHMACNKETESVDDADIFKGCEFPAPAVVNVLLEAGCDASAQNEDGNTALQVVKKQTGNQEQIINMLLAAGSPL